MIGVAKNPHDNPRVHVKINEERRAGSAGVMHCQPPDASGTLGQRKAVMETHIAEIRIDGDRLIPIYRIPVDAFRARGQVVGRRGLEPRT